RADGSTWEKGLLRGRTSRQPGRTRDQDVLVNGGAEALAQRATCPQIDRLPRSAAGGRFLHGRSATGERHGARAAPIHRLVAGANFSNLPANAAAVCAGAALAQCRVEATELRLDRTRKFL